jgi:hypothetical protein
MSTLVSQTHAHARAYYSPTFCLTLTHTYTYTYMYTHAQINTHKRGNTHFQALASEVGTRLTFGSAMFNFNDSLVKQVCYQQLDSLNLGGSRMRRK